jgi:hypothetical protein
MVEGLRDVVVVGRWYRIVLEAGGSVEGKVRSVSLPEGLMLNVDGLHRIWVAGNKIEWFLRPEEVRSVREIDPPPKDAWLCAAGLPGHLRRFSGLDAVSRARTR